MCDFFSTIGLTRFHNTVAVESGTVLTRHLQYTLSKTNAGFSLKRFKKTVNYVHSRKIFKITYIVDFSIELFIALVFAF